MSFVITQPYQFIAGLDGEALDAGTIYYGQPNLDPVQYPKAVYYDAALTIPAPQPLRTVGGYIVRNGTPTSLFANDSYSILVLDKHGRQVYFVADFFLIGNATPIIPSQVPFPVDSIAALKALNKTIYKYAQVTGYYAHGDGGGGLYYYDSADTTSADNGGTIIVAADGGRWKLIFTETVTVLQFGVKADAGVTDNSTALTNVRNWIAADPIKHRVDFPAGSYGYTVSPNWAIQNAVIRGIGEVHLKYTGTGDAVIIDGVAAPNLGVYNMTMTGFTVDALTTSGNGVFVNYCHHSTFKFKVRGAGAAKAGIRTGFCVVTHFDNCEVSPNADGGWYLGAKPLYGFYITGPSSVLQTSYCTFTNAIAEACTTANGAGIFLECSLGNIFNGGTSEGCTTGVLTANAAAGCVSNKFFGMDLEANITQDIYEQGFNNEYHSCDTNLLVNIIGGSLRTQFFGGIHHNITIASGSQSPGFYGVIWNRNGGGAFTIGDNSVRIRDCFDHTANKPGPFPQTNVVAGASPWTYTNTKGRDVVLAVSVAGGTVSTVQITRAGVGTLIAQTTGLFPVSPQDQITFTYTGVLSVWEYTK